MIWFVKILFINHFFCPLLRIFSKFQPLKIHLVCYLTQKKILLSFYQYCVTTNESLNTLEFLIALSTPRLFFLSKFSHLIKNHKLIEFWKKVHNIAVKIQILFAYQVVAATVFWSYSKLENDFNPILDFQNFEKDLI